MNEQKRKNKYKDIGILDSFIDQLVKEGDRATVILAVAKLDLILSQILQKHLISIPGSKDELLDDDGPLSTFSAKIHIAYRLGLIDNLFAHSLHLIRKIRNNFAHEVEGCSLNSGSHRDRVRELIAPVKDLESFRSTCDLYKKLGTLTLASIQFRTMSGYMCLYLEYLYEDCSTLVGKNALGLLHTAKIRVPKTISKTNKS